LYKLYKGSLVKFVHLHPHEQGMKQIGHFGVFKQSAAERLWPLTLDWLRG
jgi:predicted alpha/beta hydrolase